MTTKLAAAQSTGACRRSAALPFTSHPWTPARGGKEKVGFPERIESANDAARVQPRKAGYFNAVQVFPYSPGALYQIYAAPGQITCDYCLEPGEKLIGSGSISAGDTVSAVGERQR